MLPDHLGILEAAQNAGMCVPQKQKGAITFIVTTIKHHRCF